MTTYRTGNPLGSKDPRDLYDNAENFDAAINDVENPSFEDRFGRQRTTLRGYDDQFQQFLLNSGYENIGDYAAGLEITARNQIFWRDGELYRAGAVLELPYTTTGDWGSEEGLFVAVGDQSLRQDLAQPSGAGMVGYGDGTVDEALDELYSYSSNMPAAYDADSLVSLVSENSVVWIPPGVEIFARDIELPDDFTLVVDGALRMPPGSPDGSVILKKNGGRNARVVGRGEVDGNKTEQSGADVRHMLVHFVNVDSAEFSVSRCGGNYWPRVLPSTPVGGAVFFDQCPNSIMQNSKVTDYAREGFWMLMCDHSKMLNLTAIGGDDSWSGFQFSGSFNEASNWLSIGAGASSGSFDCMYSTINGWIGKDNRFANTVNFGHQGYPASYSVATNIISIGGDDMGTGNTMNGINVGGSTVGLQLKNIQVEGSVSSGVNISDNSKQVSVAGAVIKNCGGYAITAFSNTPDNYRVSNLEEAGNLLGTIRATGSAVVRVQDSFLSIGPSYSAPAAVVLRNTPVSGGALSGGVSIAGAVPSSPVTVSNSSVRENSVITLQPTNTQAVEASPFVSSINNGSFLISVNGAAAGGAFCRYSII